MNTLSEVVVGFCSLWAVDTVENTICFTHENSDMLLNLNWDIWIKTNHWSTANTPYVLHEALCTSANTGFQFYNFSTVLFS